MIKEREKHILQQLLKNKSVTVKELARELYASEPSIRRDLKSLETQGLIRRVHGGAMLEEHSSSLMKIPFVMRELENSDAKLIIAKKAAELVNDGDTIMLDASSSAYALIPFLAKKSNITVITSGVKALMLLTECGINTYSTGGHVIGSCLSLVERDSYNMLSSYNADVAFFSCRGVSADGMLTDFSIEENVVRQTMIKRSKKAYLLCASEKIGKCYMHNLCHIDDIDGIITENEN
jgi:DeoR/GlpR family transcriptional regulator of sugar metabolism